MSLQAPSLFGMIDNIMRTFAFALLIAVISGLADAQSLQIMGKFGYLDEYELSAEVAKTFNEKQFSGRMTIRHVGVCTHNGANQMEGQISLEFSDVTSRTTAILLFDGQRCTYSGSMSKVNVGELVCPAGKVPFKIWPE
jgi:hypothetical protein